MPIHLPRHIHIVIVVLFGVGVSVGLDVVGELFGFAVGLFPVDLHVDGLLVGAFGEGVRGLDWGGALVVFAGAWQQFPGPEEGFSAFALDLHLECY
jgi:hypothetical protein